MFISSPSSSCTKAQEHSVCQFSLTHLFITSTMGIAHWECVTGNSSSVLTKFIGNTQTVFFVFSRRSYPGGSKAKVSWRVTQQAIRNCYVNRPLLNCLQDSVAIRKHTHLFFCVSLMSTACSSLKAYPIYINVRARTLLEAKDCTPTSQCCTCFLR